MNDIYQSMLSAYDLTTDQQQRNAKYEINPVAFPNGRQAASLAVFLHGTLFHIA